MWSENSALHIQYYCIPSHEKTFGLWDSIISMYLANLSHQIIYLKFQQPFSFFFLGKLKIHGGKWWLLYATWITIYLISYPISYPIICLCFFIFYFLFMNMIRLCLVVFIRSYLISTYFYEKIGHTLVSLFFYWIEISWKNTFFFG